jgi:hypothetical protein
MLEAAQSGPRFTISVKRSTKNSSAINKLPADYPIFGSFATLAYFSHVRFYSESDQPADIPKSTLSARTGLMHCSK